MKKICWMGNTHEEIKSLPADARQDAGYALDLVQRGFEPLDWKPMSSIGAGVKEIRIHASNEYRVIYVAKFADYVYVLHAFEKKSQKTPKKDLLLAKQRFAELKSLRSK